MWVTQTANYNLIYIRQLTKTNRKINFKNVKRFCRSYRKEVFLMIIYVVNKIWRHIAEKHRSIRNKEKWRKKWVTESTFQNVWIWKWSSHRSVRTLFFIEHLGWLLQLIINLLSTIFNWSIYNISLDKFLVCYILLCTSGIYGQNNS